MTSRITVEPCAAFRVQAYNLAEGREEDEVFKKHLDEGCAECSAFIDDCFSFVAEGIEEIAEDLERKRLEAASTQGTGEFPWKTVLAILAFAIFFSIWLLG